MRIKEMISNDEILMFKKNSRNRYHKKYKENSEENMHADQ